MMNIPVPTKKMIIMKKIKRKLMKEYINYKVNAVISKNKTMN